MPEITLRRISIGLFVAAAVVAVSGVLTFAWPSLPSGALWLVGVGLGLLGLVASGAYAFFSEPDRRWWGPLVFGASLAVLSYVAVPAASAVSSATYAWAHRSELDRAAAILLSAERASGSWSGARCQGLSESDCAALADVLVAVGSASAWGGSGGDGPKVHVSLRGDYDAVRCPSRSCDYGWTIPVGAGWQIVGP